MFVAGGIASLNFYAKRRLHWPKLLPARLKEIRTCFCEKLEYCKFIISKMEAMKKAPGLTNKDKGKEILDANLWGKLQEHIPLQVIYEKLSQRDLFQLRLVSKEWNHASLQWILPKLSFVFIAAGVDPAEAEYLNGIVTYNSVCGTVKFNRQRLHLLYSESHVPPFEVEGLILCHNPDDLEQRGVFNVHTQTWHAIPPGPGKSGSLSACGLLVDTTIKPYTFKLIEGNCRFGTQIYDSKSRSWSRTFSILYDSKSRSGRRTFSRPANSQYLWTPRWEYSCICHNDNIYMSASTDLILKYCLEDDKWTSLKSPGLKNYRDPYPALGPPALDNTLGVWAGRIFTTTENRKKQIVTVWELVDSEGQEWVEYARMSNELYEWLLKHYIFDNGFFEESVILRSFFRDGYLLICSWRWVRACVNELVLFDMATKIWRKVDLPRGTVSGN